MSVGVKQFSKGRYGEKCDTPVHYAWSLVDMGAITWKERREIFPQVVCLTRDFGLTNAHAKITEPAIFLVREKVTEVACFL